MKREEFEAQLNEQLKRLQDTFKGNPTVLNYLDRGLCQCYNNPQNGILVLGINPSYPQKTEEQRKLNGVTFGYTFSTADNRYFDSLKFILCELSDKTGYLDLFPIKESVQNTFINDIIKNKACLPMLVDRVADTQQKIEELKPRLIILKNKHLAPFVGLHKKFTWMGYEFEEVPNPIEGKDVELYRIIGIKSDNVSGIAQTALVGTYVLHYGLYKFVNRFKDKILDEFDIKKLWETFCED